MVNNPSEIGLAIANARRLLTFVVGSSKSTPTENDIYLTEQPGNLIPLDRGKGVPSFDEMMYIALVEVDFDDPTTNVRGRHALAIAKPTSKGLLTMP